MQGFRNPSDLHELGSSITDVVIKPPSRQVDVNRSEGTEHQLEHGVPLQWTADSCTHDQEAYEFLPFTF
jgi:hypothetical protein